jgi:hypothetical protein
LKESKVVVVVVEEMEGKAIARLRWDHCMHEKFIM